jgi:excisionase family DNA binding protein
MSTPRNTAGRIRFFSIADVAEFLDVATRTVRRLISSGELVAHRFRGVVRIAEDDLRKFLNAHRGDEEDDTNDHEKEKDGDE